MIGRGQWDSTSNSLYVRFQEVDWHIMIRRCDGKPCEHMRNYDGRDVSADTLKDFLPHWQSLTWQPTRTFDCHVLSAEDGDFRVRLLAAMESSLSKDQIIDQFKEFMIAAQRTRSPVSEVTQ